MFGCKHKFGKIEDGYQYCTKCGKAKAAPFRECEHKWEIINQFSIQITDNWTNGILYICQCTKCGDIKKNKIKSAD